MRLVYGTMLSFIFVCFTSFLHAQNIDDYVSIEPAGDWIVSYEVPAPNLKYRPQSGIEYLLADMQVMESGDDRIWYDRFADRLTKRSAIETEATLSIRFDPSFQTLALHHIRIIRDGVASDRIDLAEMQLYRVETERDRLIYNGDLELAYIVPDVRVGDILDYAYSIKGKNPAWGSQFTFGASQQYSVPVGRITNRILIKDGLDHQIKGYANAAEPEITRLDGFTELKWNADTVAGLDVEEDRPYWNYGYPISKVTSFRDWKAVGTHFSRAYDPKDRITSAITDIANEIKAEHPETKHQLRAALDYVQSNIRYLGIELGAGGYVPRAPDRVLKRRFGDCKDMTLLLLAILSELEIEASPLLVNLDDGHGLEITLPSIGVFDHVIVTAFIDGQQYFLDPTKGKQLGDIDHMEQGDYGKGLVISTNGPGLIDAKGYSPEFNRDFLDVFDVTDPNDMVVLSSKSTYHGDQADSMLAWVEEEGREAVEAAFLSYFEDYYPTIEQYGPFLILTDETTATLTFSSFYKIPDAWDEDTDLAEMQFGAYTGELNSDIPDFVEGARKSDFALQHPKRTKYQINIVQPETWDAEIVEFSISKPAFDYRESRKRVDGVVENTFEFESKSHKIEAADFEDTMSSIEEIEERVGVLLWYSTQTPG